MFCSKCGAMLVEKQIKSCKEKACPGKKKGAEAITLSETVEKKEEISVVDEHADANVHPEIDAECPECGHNKARYWVVQTRSADEAPTKFNKCSKCNHTWRDYS